MKYRKRLASIVTLITVTFAAAPAVPAQLASKTTGGTLALQVVSGESFDRDQALPIVFVWHPGLGSQRSGYQVTAECRRRDRLGAPPGAANRVLFDLAMTSVASGERYELGRRSRRLARDGQQVDLATWTDSALDSFVAAAGGEGVLVRLEVAIRRGALEFGDTFGCRCEVAETDPRGLGLPIGSVGAARR